MGYLLYSLVFIVLLTGTALYFTRSRWMHLVPYPLFPDFVYHRLPTTFAGDVEAGFQSSNFDLAGNITSEDSRQGLDEAGKRAVQQIMKRRGVGFDEARKIFMEQKFKKNNIGADGLPRDPKFVSFS